MYTCICACACNLCTFMSIKDLSQFFYLLVDPALRMFVRVSAFENQPPEAAAALSIQLSLPGSFTTSPIHLSLLGAQTLAWRTRLVSLKGMWICYLHYATHWRVLLSCFSCFEKLASKDSRSSIIISTILVRKWNVLLSVQICPRYWTI